MTQAFQLHIPEKKCNMLTLNILVTLQCCTTSCFI